jgi:putative ABC transport system substrate-binding protein
VIALFAGCARLKPEVRAVDPKVLTKLTVSIVAFLAAVFLAFPPGAGAREARKVARIGYLSQTSAENDKNYVAAFQQGLKELGYLEGKNIIIEQRYAAGRTERLPGLAAELVRLNVDVFVVFGVAAVRAVRKENDTVPIVLPNLTDPVAAGFASSLARPGGTVTGLSDFHPATVTKRLSLLKETVPTASRVAILFNPANPSHPNQLKDLQAAAPALGVALLPLEIRRASDIDTALGKIAKENPGALLLLGDVLLSTHQRKIAEFALKNRLPAMYTVRAFVDAGGLIAYGTNFADMWRRAAAYVDKILKGAKPADLPIEQASKFDLMINLKTAKALGLTIPPSVLLGVDQVIQ